MRATHTAQTPPINRMLGLQDESQRRKTSLPAPLQQKGQTHLASTLYYKPIAPSCADVSALLRLGWLETNCSAALDLQNPLSCRRLRQSIAAATSWGLLRAPKWWTKFLCKTEYHQLPSFRGCLGSQFCLCDLRFLLSSNNTNNFVATLGR